MYLGRIFYLAVWLSVGCALPGCGGGGGGGGVSVPSPTENPDNGTVTGRVVLGPIAGARVEIYPLSAIGSAPLYVTMTSGGPALDQAGRFSIPADLLTDNTLYLLKATGGQDLDVDDDGSPDAQPTPNQGAVHAVLTAEQMRRGDFQVSILTEVIYQRLYYLLAAEYPDEAIRAEMNLRAALVLAGDIDGDGDRDMDDIPAWQPQRDAAKLRRGAAAYRPLIQQLLAGEPVAAEGLALTERRLGTLELSEQLSDFGCEIGNIAVVGPIAYLLTSYGLRVVDISDPVQPRLLNSLNLSPDLSLFVSRVAAVGDRVYVLLVNPSSSVLALRVLDASDPTRPVPLGSLELAGQDARDLKIVGNTLWVAGSEGLYAIDVGNPANPILLSQTAPAALDLAAVESIEVVNTTAYIVGTKNGSVQAFGLRTLDIGNPAGPVRLGGLDGSCTVDEPDLCVPSNIEIAGQFGYFATHDSLGLKSQLQIIDIGDPVRPVLSGTVDTLNFVWRDISIVGTILYIPQWIQVRAFDISNPGHPVSLGIIHTPTSRIDVVEGIAYSRSPSCELWLADFSNPANPAVLNMVAEVREPVEAITGNTAYAGRQILDISDPVKPVIVGSTSEPLIAVENNIAYGFDRSDVPGESKGVVKTFAISNPTQPVVQGALTVERSIQALAQKQGIVYLVTRDFFGRQGLTFLELLMVNATSPTTLVALGPVYTPGMVNKIEIAGNLAFVIDEEIGLQIFDISTPASPQRLGSVSYINSRSLDIAVAGNRAYLVGYGLDLKIIDFSDPVRPTVSGFTPESSQPHDVNSEIIMADDIAYVIGTKGLQVFDIGEPANLRLLSRTDVPGADRIKQVKGYIYVMDLSSGLHIVRAITRQVP